MNPDILVVAEHMKGELSDITLEMLACGRELADATSSGLTCVTLTNNASPFKSLPLTVNQSIIIENPALESFNPETYSKILSHLIKELSPRLVLLGHTGIGMDIAGALSISLGAPVIGNCVNIKVEDKKLLFSSKLYGGKLTAQSEIEEGLSIGLLMPGSYPKEGGMRNDVPQVDIKSSPVSLDGIKIQFKELLEPEVGDIDITKNPVLIGAGRGVQNANNIKTLEELATLLGGAVCATRPVIDQGWLPRTRQVGRSGMIVKPRLYMALGVSGAPEHVEGMKDSDLIIAVNTDPSAPIFEVAHYGATIDMQDLIPILTEKIKELKGGA
ncbi:MAG: hypothetical protein AM326_09520 [Candidatus Thorarchaeota archaeon SMTZ-45]|nr:MAG: hypothetical protein AM326_09520 [Candidatus Thorarchaeota archaeon SMTZ-45]